MHHTNITKLLAIFLLTSLLFSIFPLSQTARASEPPPWGDWVVENNTTVTNETIIVHGDVIVKSGGTLTLINCVLKIDSPIPGLNGIEVEKGGGLCVYDTIITSNGASQYYYFEVYGMVMIDGADISKMYLDGLVICDTKDVAIKNSSVHDGGPIAYGICFANSTGTILNNNIYNNFRGIVIVGESKVSISNNIITSNYDDGISCIDDSEVSINSNTISNTYGERGRGISIQGNSKVNISNNIITSNYQLGIFCGHDSEANINNNTISDTYSERGRGIDIEDNSKVNISNNIITSNRQAGIFCARNSEVNINNNTISETYGKRGRGIGIEDNSKVSISNNIITSNCRGGILCSHDAEVIINNNTISYTYDENGAGVGTTDNSKAGISNNIITSNTYGVVCLENSTVSINNNIISKNGELGDGSAIQVRALSIVNISNNDIISNRHGISVYGSVKINVYNSRIAKSSGYDLWVGNSSHSILINTEFALDKLRFDDDKSIISIGHWVDVSVKNKNNVPVQNTRVTITNKDSAEVFNGTSDYDGRISCIPVIEYNLDYTFTKKFYTPHNIHASKLGRSASEKITVDRNRLVNFTLDISDKLARGNLITKIVQGHEVSVEYLGNGTVIIEPATMPAKIPNATKDIGIFVDIKAVGEVQDLYITIRYSDDDVKGVNEANLRMYCYFGHGDFAPGDFAPGDFEFLAPGNFTLTGGWVRIRSSGVDTYNNIVWAQISHCTIFAPLGEEIAKHKGENPWLLYGGAGATSIAILWAIFFITFRKKLSKHSKSSK